MKIKVKVKPNSKQSKVIGEKNGFLVVRVKSKPDKGKANRELVKLLKEYYNSKVRIIRGFKSKRKTVVVQDDMVS